MKPALRLAVSLALMLAFLYWAFSGLQPGEIWAAVKRVEAGWLAVLVLIILVTVVLRGWRWVVLLRPVAPQVSVADATLALTICYSVNVAVPRAGEAARALSLKWTRGASVSAVLGTVVVERVIDLMWLTLLIALSAALIPGRIEQVFPWLRAVVGLTIAGTVALLAGMLAVSLYRDRGVAFVHRLLARLSQRLADTVADLLAKFIQGLVALRTPSAYLEILLSSLLLNLGYVLIIYVSFLAFGFHTPPESLGASEALVIMAISSLGVVVPTPAGTGSYHYFFGHSLKALFSVALAPAMACATLVHAVSNLTYMAIGVPALLLQRRRRTTSLSEEMSRAQQAMDQSPGRDAPR